MAGLNGFEPLHAGVKVQCLTAWRQPNLNLNYLRQETLYIIFYILSIYYYIFLYLIIYFLYMFLCSEYEKAKKSNI